MRSLPATSVACFILIFSPIFGCMQKPTTISQYCGEAFCLSADDMSFREKRDDMEDFVVHYFDIGGARVSIYEGNAPVPISPSGTEIIGGLSWLYEKQSDGTHATVETGYLWPAYISVFAGNSEPAEAFAILRSLTLRKKGPDLVQ